MQDKDGAVYIIYHENGLKEVGCLATQAGVVPPNSPIVTDYSDNLIRKIFESYGSVHTCDEISRDSDETEASLDVRYSIMAHFFDGIFAQPLNILDYGCGGGSSTLTLARLFSDAHVTGVDISERFLGISKLRMEHYGYPNTALHTSSHYGLESDTEETFDLVFLNAVYEHLLPEERPNVLRSIWNSLKRGGVLIINQTPHRWFPIETHTTGLPLINYLPPRLTRWVIHKFSTRRRHRQETWSELLRAGVRGATIREIEKLLRGFDSSVYRLRTVRISKSHAGIWYAAKQARLKKLQSTKTVKAIAYTQKFVSLTHLPLTPYINVAFSKGPSLLMGRKDSTQADGL